MPILIRMILLSICLSVTGCVNNASTTMGNTLYAGNYTPIIGSDPAKVIVNACSVKLPER